MIKQFRWKGLVSLLLKAGLPSPVGPASHDFLQLNHENLSGAEMAQSLLTNLFCCLIPSWKHPWHPTSTSQLAICGCCPLLHCLTGWGWVTPLGAVVLYPLGCLFTRLHEPKCHNCLQVMRFRPPTIFVTLCWTLSSFSASLCNLRVQTWASYRHCLSCVEERSGSNFLLCPGHTPNVLSTQN